MNGETLVLGKLADVTSASVEDSSLAPREFMLARMTALIQVGAPPAYVANTEASSLPEER